MKKLVISVLVTAVLATAGFATDKYTGDLTYVQVRPDGNFAVKVLPNGETTEIYGIIKAGDKGKAMYAAALTALTSGKQVEMWKEGGYWDTLFLRK